MASKLTKPKLYELYKEVSDKNKVLQLFTGVLEGEKKELEEENQKLRESKDTYEDLLGGENGTIDKIEELKKENEKLKEENKQLNLKYDINIKQKDIYIEKFQEEIKKIKEENEELQEKLQKYGQSIDNITDQRNTAYDEIEEIKKMKEDIEMIKEKMESMKCSWGGDK